MNFTEKQGKIICAAVLVIIWAILLVLLALVGEGVAPGLDAGHPSEYLVMSFFVCSVLISTVPILWFLNIARMPSWFALLIFANVYYYCLSLFFGFYLTIDWWGTVAHVISSMFVSSIVFLALCIIQTHSPSHVTLGSNNGIVMLQILIGISFGGLWEVMEGYVDIILAQQYMSYGVWDMLVDIRADIIGALIMGAVFWWMLRTHTVKDIADSTHLGFLSKKN